MKPSNYEFNLHKKGTFGVNNITLKKWTNSYMPLARLSLLADRL